MRGRTVARGIGWLGWVRRHRGLVAAGALFVVTGLLAAAETPWAAERAVGRWVYDWPSWTTNPLEIAMQVGSGGAVLVTVAALVVLGQQRPALAAALAGAGTWLLSTAVKEVVERHRPTAASLGRVPREVVDGFAWPSSHASISAALATVLLLTVVRTRVGRAIVVAAVALTMAARVHLAVHWPLDVLGGAAFGTLLGYVAVRVARA